MTENAPTAWWLRRRNVVLGVVGGLALLVAGTWTIARATGASQDSPPPATTTATPTPTATGTPTVTTAAARCSAEVYVSAEWDGGFQVDMEVVAIDGRIDDWTVTFDMGNATVASAWNSTLAAGDTGAVEAANLDYNGTVEDGYSTGFGFVGNGVADIREVTCASSSASAAASAGHTGDDAPHTSVSPGDVSAATNAPSGDDWLSVDGNTLVNAQGEEVWLTGANWFGFNTTERVLHGLWTTNMADTVAAVADHGLNVLRIPISTELLLEWRAGKASTSTSVNVAVNPELDGLTTLEVFDAFLVQSKAHGIKVILDVHSAEADNAGHIAPVWHTERVSEEDFFVAWEWVAARYAHDDTIIGFDLQNEPHGKPPEEVRATWGDGGTNDWHAVASEAAQRIHSVHPDALLIVEGIEATPKDGVSWASQDPGEWNITWWGGNLRLAGDTPVDGPQDKLMYSPHDYGPLVYEQPWFQGEFSPASLEEDVWGPNWLYLHDEGLSPLLIGEWGGRLGEDDRQDQWLTALRDLIANRQIHHTFWALNPNSGDTGGLLLDDWATWDADKMAMLDSVLWKDADGAPQGLDHDIALG